MPALAAQEYSEHLVLATTDDELYGYGVPPPAAGVYRLTAFERGALNANKDDANRQADRREFGGDRQTRISAGRKPRCGGNWDSTTVDAAGGHSADDDFGEVSRVTDGGT